MRSGTRRPVRLCPARQRRCPLFGLCAGQVIRINVEMRGRWVCKKDKIKNSNDKQNKLDKVALFKSKTWIRKSSGVSVEPSISVLERWREIPVFLALSAAFLRTNYLFSPCTFVFSFSFPRIFPEFSAFTFHFLVTNKTKNRNYLRTLNRFVTSQGKTESNWYNILE